MGSTYAWAALAMVSTAAGIATFLTQLSEHIPVVGTISPTWIGVAFGILIVFCYLRSQAQDDA